ncbi:hypothetical protein H2199_001197 [Coniosporium tulheliwenetii]|uniref:Uncharacterized protein n=1 Tax=Coniosporium tulheliwenetii TaxID=3383036 RepID=A0ACC2ZL61_9PEZI|nr:hypothetical protein H2199_001197 [Cladosporium sp. JES 115]
MSGNIIIQSKDGFQIYLRHESSTCGRVWPVGADDKFAGECFAITQMQFDTIKFRVKPSEIMLPSYIETFTQKDLDFFAVGTKGGRLNSISMDKSINIDASIATERPIHGYPSSKARLICVEDF